LGLRLGDGAGVVAQPVELGPDRLRRRQLLVGVAVLRDQLPPHLGGGQAGIQPGAAELRIGLALAIDQRGDVRQQVGQMLLGALAPTQREGVDNGEAAVHLARALADRRAIPAQLTLGAPLAARPQFLRRPGHEDPAGAPLQALGGLDEQRLERVRQLHPSSQPLLTTPPARQYICRDNLFPLDP